MFVMSTATQFLSCQPIWSQLLKKRNVSPDPQSKYDSRAPARWFNWYRALPFPTVAPASHPRRPETPPPPSHPKAQLKMSPAYGAPMYHSCTKQRPTGRWGSRCPRGPSAQCLRPASPQAGLPCRSVRALTLPYDLRIIVFVSSCFSLTFRLWIWCIVTIPKPVLWKCWESIVSPLLYLLGVNSEVPRQFKHHPN